jgi:hypothetical protein
MSELLMVQLPVTSAHKDYLLNSKLDLTDPVQKMLQTAIDCLDPGEIRKVIDSVGSVEFRKYFNVDPVDGNREEPDWKAVDGE